MLRGTHLAKAMPSMSATGVRLMRLVTSPMAHTPGTLVRLNSSTWDCCRYGTAEGSQREYRVHGVDEVCDLAASPSIMFLGACVNKVHHLPPSNFYTCNTPTLRRWQPPTLMVPSGPVSTPRPSSPMLALRGARPVAIMTSAQGREDALPSLLCKGSRASPSYKH